MKACWYYYFASEPDALIYFVYMCVCVCVSVCVCVYNKMSAQRNDRELEKMLLWWKGPEGEIALNYLDSYNLS